MKEDLVSIIMPSYNTGKFIKETINSVLNQTYNNWELIIVDDCSTDDTEEIVNAIKDNRIKFLKNSTNSGAAISRNKAIKEAKKSIPKDISLIGYDDLIYSQLLDVPLTTIHQDMDGIATAIGDLIINILEKGSNELTIKVVPSYLVERTSVCRKEA